MAESSLIVEAEAYLSEAIRLLRQAQFTSTHDGIGSTLSGSSKLAYSLQEVQKWWA
jgi:hypothetical protein